MFTLKWEKYNSRQFSDFSWVLSVKDSQYPVRTHHDWVELPGTRDMGAVFPEHFQMM